MNEHTPGPWKCKDSAALGISILDDFDGYISLVYHMSMKATPERGSTRANARLIAAAPDLLAACEAVLAMNVIKMWRALGGTEPSLDRALKLAREAIAKTRGEG